HGLSGDGGVAGRIRRIDLYKLFIDVARQLVIGRIVGKGKEQNAQEEARDHTLGFSPEIDVIRKVVVIGRRIVWEICRQLLADFFDSPDKTGGEVALAKFFGHDGHHAMPELLAHALMDTRIAQYNELST